MRKNRRIGGDVAGDTERDAAAFAAAQVAAVRDDPAGRLALARSMYEEPIGRRALRLRFQRAAFPSCGGWRSARVCAGPRGST